MSAGEFFAITSGKNIALYGIEDDPIYRQNVEEFNRVYELNGVVGKDIAGILGDLRKISDKIYPDGLKAVERDLALYRDGKIPFSSMWDSLQAINAVIARAEGPKESRRFR